MMKYCPNCGEDLTQYQSKRDFVVVQTADVPGENLVTTNSTPDLNAPYDQVKIWRELVATADKRRIQPPTTLGLVNVLMEGTPNVETGHHRGIVHIVFDRPVTPAGGMLGQLVRSDGHQTLDAEMFKDRGYVLEDNKVKLVEGVPVGLGYAMIQYWGGEKQHKRWHLKEPVTVNPSRNGNPYFMDDNLVAFGTVWADLAKFSDAMGTLLDYFAKGRLTVKSTQKAIPLDVRVVWH